MTTINFWFYDKKCELAIGDTVTVFCANYGHFIGERATLYAVRQRYAEFVTESGSVVKVYAHKAGGGMTYYLGHMLPAGWRKWGWLVDPNPDRTLTKIRQPKYLNDRHEWCTR